jgi:hypothetical protein
LYPKFRASVHQLFLILCNFGMTLNKKQRECPQMRVHSQADSSSEEEHAT